MALCVPLLGYLILACALNDARAQPLEESVFRPLTAAELREIDLRQNPGLLDLAARTGEMVTINITGTSQGVVVQEDVNTVLNCGPWLRNYPGGTVNWFRFSFNDLDHQDLNPLKSPLIPADLVPARSTITGDYNEIFTIVRALIAQSAQGSSRGVYECQVCVGIGLFEMCHSANTTVAVVGRPPILDKGTGRIPFSVVGGLASYNIGQTVCLQIDPSDPERNIPALLARLHCSDVGSRADLNIPSAFPPGLVTWTHISEDGTLEANFTENLRPTDVSNAVPPERFGDLFPMLLSGQNFETFAPVSGLLADTSALDFLLDNVTRNASTPAYRAIMQAFGRWTCTFSNSLGSDTASSFVTDNCGRFIPSIVRNCAAIGDLVDQSISLVQRGQAVPIPAGCDVCIRQSSELWLTLTCQTNLNTLSNVIVMSESFTWTDERGNVLGNEHTLLVSKPGTYTCTADFGGGESDTATSSVGFVPEVQLLFMHNNITDSGCERLRTDYEFSHNDVCAFVMEMITLDCVAMQENVTGVPVLFADQMNMPLNQFSATINDDRSQIVCRLNTANNEDIEERCVNVGGGSLNLTVYDPATILIDGSEECTASAGDSYDRVPVAGDPVILCCGAGGFPEPTQTWSRTVINRAGVAEEVLVTGNSSGIRVEGNRLIIEVYDPALHDGTYVCRAKNLAGIDEATIALYSGDVGAMWASSEWSECDPLCVDGTRSRTVWCETTPERIVVPDINCGNCSNKPLSNGACTNVDGLGECFVTPLWRTGEFSACSRGCAGGVRYREVFCAIPLDGTVVDDILCRELYPGGMPPAYDICFNKCCTNDIYPGFCQSTGTGQCGNPVYQQYCCWTCGLTEFP